MRASETESCKGKNNGSFTFSIISAFYMERNVRCRWEYIFKVLTIRMYVCVDIHVRMIVQNVKQV